MFNNTLIKNTSREVLGMVQSQNPCSTEQIRHECIVQTTDFEKLSTWDQNLLLEHVFNAQLLAGSIRISLCGSPAEIVLDLPI